MIQCEMCQDEELDSNLETLWNEDPSRLAKANVSSTISHSDLSINHATKVCCIPEAKIVLAKIEVSSEAYIHIYI